jgi:hypothetical protein
MGPSTNDGVLSLENYKHPLIIAESVVKITSNELLFF